MAKPADDERGEHHAGAEAHDRRHEPARPAAPTADLGPTSP